MSTHNLVFLPSGRRGIVEQGTTLQAAARSLGEGIETVCGGKASCGKCKVRILEGTQNNINSSMAHLVPIAGDETQYLEQYGLQPDERLSCQARICGDLVVYVPDESRIGRQSILKTAGHRSIDIIPSIRQYYIELPYSGLNEAILATALEHRFGLVNIAIDPQVLQSLSDVSTKSQGITITVWDEKEIIRIQPGNVDKAYGMAVDIGTTTIGSYLCDLASGEIVATAAMMNPQIRFGEDIMTRIAYAKVNPDGLTELNQTVIEALNELARTITAQAGLIPDDIVEMVAVGNTTQCHRQLVTSFVS
ncbi:MAG: 2Fe-2S iron-sulfur cluster binding domain-containing protein [Chloroflexi bacterium]|nr:2Fe-2S iron-sulfur cluster binding domain-containing protein [Chloroflexota bacterium]